jgi:hypothetical protein
MKLASVSRGKSLSEMNYCGHAEELSTLIE